MDIRFLKAFLPLVVILLVGTLGYQQIEGWPAFDSLYMTVISLTTVGYGEVRPLSQAGRVFTMVLIITGIGNFAYVITNLSAQVLDPIFNNVLKQKMMEKKLANLEGHYIICGYGRIGRDVAKDLRAAGLKVVILDRKPPENLIGEKLDFPFVVGDASQEENLLKAGILHARGLVAAVRSEAENVFITMSARELNTKLFIIARYEEESTQKKLKRAGADRVINPYRIGSEKISQIILKPTINKILDVASRKGDLNLNFEELEIQPGNPLIGKSVKECHIRDKYNIIIIAVEKETGEIITTPGPDYRLQLHDRLVMIGNESELLSLTREFKFT